MALTDLIETPPQSPSKEESDIDIFHSAIPNIFTDNTRNQHGDPGGEVIYKSSRFGNLLLRFAKDNPEDTSLFAHYLWNAAILMSEIIGDAPPDSPWRVQDKAVIELGAGSGVVGIVSRLAGAASVSITDYPSDDILANIEQNRLKILSDAQKVNVGVFGHKWGSFNDDFSQRMKGGFARVVAADCFWMPAQHSNLVSSMIHFLSDDATARILMVGGFHTGRYCMAAFLDQVEADGLVIESVFERDVDGKDRPWQRERLNEDIIERKRWLVVAVLRRKISEI